MRFTSKWSRRQGVLFAVYITPPEVGEEVEVAQPIEADDLGQGMTCVGLAHHPYRLNPDGTRALQRDALGCLPTLAWVGPVTIRYIHETPLELQ